MRNILLTSPNANGEFDPKIIEAFWSRPVAILCGNRHRDILEVIAESPTPAAGLVFVATSGRELALPPAESYDCRFVYVYSLPRTLSESEGARWRDLMMKAVSFGRADEPSPTVRHQTLEGVGLLELNWRTEKGVESEQIKRCAISIDNGYEYAHHNFR